MKRSRSFKGGIVFSNYLGQPKNVLLDAPTPERVIIPLRQGFGAEVDPLVKVGDYVCAGQAIGRSDGVISSPIHSSVYGKVEDIKRMNYFKREVMMVVIRAEKKPGFEKLEGATAQWERLSGEELERLIYLSGVSALDRDGIPTRYRSSVIMPYDVEELIVHGVGSEPFNASLDVLLAEKRIFRLVDGVRILKKIMPRAKVHLALNARKKKLLEEIKKITAKYDWLDVVPLAPKYPQGYDEMLTQTILGRKFPYGYSAANIGIIILNLQAAIGVWEAVAEGKPLIERIVALCGPNFKENIHLRVKVGTPLGEVLKERLVSATKIGGPATFCGGECRKSRVILNVALTGALLNDFSLPVDKTSSHIIALEEQDKREFMPFAKPGLRRHSYARVFLSSILTRFGRYCDTNMHGEPRPCISCGYCEEVCPVAMIPHLLSKYIQAQLIDETLMRFRIFNCIECGLCSFVCPSKIPLMKHIKEGQDKLVMEGCDRSQCVLPYFDAKGIEEYRGVRELK